jgi:hypothetical protein
MPTNGMSSRSPTWHESQTLIDDIQERLAALEPIEVLAKEVDQRLPRLGHVGRHVRRYDHVGHSPERMIRGQRLGLEDIERGAG